VVNVLRNREAAGATAETVRKHGVQAWTMRANVSEPAAIDRMCVAIVAAAGGVDIMVSR
jgi:NAD(P)-dependent dehydrogenase (short-subunit alcohol dehydrogenase family)